MALQRAITVSTAAALVLLLAACAGGQTGPGAPNLALACQTMDCVCSEKSRGLFRAPRSAEVLWRANGDAYCPEGFVLEPAGS